MSVPQYAYIDTILVKDIEEGDIVQSFDPALIRCFDSKVISKTYAGSRQTYAIQTNQKAVFLAEDQEVLVKEEDPLLEMINYVFRNIRELAIGDELVSINKDNNIFEDMIQVITKNRVEDVWDIIVETGTFVLNGCISKNKGGLDGELSSVS